jgi:stage V sporulation protein AB
MSFVALCAGLIIAMGVFSVLIAVGLIPRFAGKTDTANHIFLYETLIVLGIISGTIASVFMDSITFAEWFGTLAFWEILSRIFLGFYGIFTGIFVGCLAVAIAEMLDAIPIFARRISFEKGIGIAILSVALGKLTGSLLYYYHALFIASH